MEDPLYRTAAPTLTKSRLLRIQLITIAVCLLPLLAWMGYEEFRRKQQIDRLHLSVSAEDFHSSLLPSGGYRIIGKLTNENESRGPIRGIKLSLKIHDCPQDFRGDSRACPVVYTSPEKEVLAYLRPGQSTRFQEDFEIPQIPQIKGRIWIEPALGHEIPDLPD